DDRDTFLGIQCWRCECRLDFGGGKQQWPYETDYSHRSRRTITLAGGQLSLLGTPPLNAVRILISVGILASAPGAPTIHKSRQGVSTTALPGNACSPDGSCVISAGRMRSTRPCASTNQTATESGLVKLRTMRRASPARMVSLSPRT